jgi:hypothetical protein
MNLALMVLNAPDLIRSVVVVYLIFPDLHFRDVIVSNEASDARRYIPQAGCIYFPRPPEGLSRTSNRPEFIFHTISGLLYLELIYHIFAKTSRLENCSQPVLSESN